MRSRLRAPVVSVRGLVACLSLLAASAPAAARADAPEGAGRAAGAPAAAVADPMLEPPRLPAKTLGSWADALDLVRARSTDLVIAVEEVRRAEAQSRVALAGALPQVVGTASYTHQFLTNEFSQIAGLGPAGPIFRDVRTPFPDALTGQISATVPVVAPRAWYAVGTANRVADASRLSLDEARRQIALGVANALVGVVTAERLAEQNRNGLRTALERQALTQRKADLGAATAVDLVRTRQDVEAARALLVTGDESLRQAREALGLALGLPEQVGVRPDARLDELATTAQGTCKPVGSLEDRPDLAALRAREGVAERQRTDAKLQFSPTVDVRSTLGTTTIDTGAIPNTTWNLQAVLSVPIWDGGARYGALRDTGAQILQAEARTEAQRRKATIEAIQTTRAVEVATQRRAVADETRRLAAENDRLTRASYDEGRGTSLELVTAAQALRDANIQLTLREFELVRARVLAAITFATCRF